MLFSDELHEKEILEANSKDIMFKTFPGFLNRSVHDDWSLQSILMLVKTNVRGHDHHEDGAHTDINSLVEFARDDNETELFMHGHSHTHGDGRTHDHEHGHFHSHERFRRGAGANHRHEYLTDAAMHRHYMLHELTHAFHLGSMVILTVLVLVTYFKMFIMGKKFLHHKIEVSLFSSLCKGTT